MKKSNNIGKVIISFIIIAVLAVGVCLAGYASRNDEGKWFRNGNISEWSLKTKGDATNYDPLQYDISIATYALSSDEFEVYGISPTALEAKSLTVEFTPTNTTNKRVNWDIKWSGNNAEWSADKDITDYVEFIPAAKNAPTATIAVKQPFADTITLDVSSRVRPELTDSISIEYCRRYYDTAWEDHEAGLNVYKGNIEFFKGNEEDYRSDVYTVEPTRIVVDLEVKCYCDFYDWLLPNGYLEERSNEFTITGVENGVLNWDRLFCDYYEGDLFWSEELISEYNQYCYTGYLFSFKPTFHIYYNDELIETRTSQFWNDWYLGAEAVKQLGTLPTNAQITPDKVVF